MYREVTMIEFREVLRLWQSRCRRSGSPRSWAGSEDRSSISESGGSGRLRAPMETISDEEVREVLLALQPSGGRPRGEGWTRCSEQREAIEHWLVDGLRLTKIRKLLVRQGVSIAYPTLHRFAVLELQFGRTATTIPILDGEPGQELQVDTGWVGWLTLPLSPQKRRRFRAWIFTAVLPGTASSIPPSRKRPPARSRRVKPLGILRRHFHGPDSG